MRAYLNRCRSLDCKWLSVAHGPTPNEIDLIDLYEWQSFDCYALCVKCDRAFTRLERQHAGDSGIDQNNARAHFYLLTDTGETSLNRDGLRFADDDVNTTCGRR